MRKIVYPFAFIIILPLLLICFLPKLLPEYRNFLMCQAVSLPLALAVRNGVSAISRRPDKGRLQRLDRAVAGLVFLELALTGYRYVWPSPFAVGAMSFLVLSAIALLLLVSANCFLMTVPERIGGRIRPFLQNVTLLAISLGVVFTGAELAFRHLPPSAGVIIPGKWEKRNVDVAGSVLSYYWHGKLHVHDKSRFRRTSPFPPKKSATFRIIAVGDSLTYGYGIAEEDTYPRLVETSLSGEYRVEVLNLGVSGAQSEDIVKTVRKYADGLDADLVVYGACLNDFLPSGKGEYGNAQYAVPLPDSFKDRVVAATKTGGFLSDRYDRLLRKLHLRDDFCDDILKGFGDYAARFRKDMGEMNRHAVNLCGAPVVAMVLDQYPVLGGRGYRISKIAEDGFRAAGMDCVPAEEYYRAYSGRDLGVSRWEGHPNEEAHRIFARTLTERIRRDGRIAAFRTARTPAARTRTP